MAAGIKPKAFLHIHGKLPGSIPPDPADPDFISGHALSHKKPEQAKKTGEAEQGCQNPVKLFGPGKGVFLYQIIGLFFGNTLFHKDLIQSNIG